MTTAAGSVVYGVGNDWDRAAARTIPAGQTKVHEFLAPTGDTFWVQRLTAAVPASGTLMSVITPARFWTGVGIFFTIIGSFWSRNCVITCCAAPRSPRRMSASP